MKRITAALVLLSLNAAAFAHPGLHHLNGVGHSVEGSDAWLTIAAVGLWALLSAVLMVKLLAKRRRERA